MTSNTENKIRLGITIGDINGVGLEVIIKTFMDDRIFDFCTPIVYGSSKIASYHCNALNIEDFSFNIIKSPKEANSKKANLINCWQDEVKVQLGQSSEFSGKYALRSLDVAINDLKKGDLQALVTAPINKNSINQFKSDFKGHTDYIKKEFNASDCLMFMISEHLKIGMVTVHEAVKDISEILSTTKILSKLQIMNRSLKQDFGIEKPKIAVLGLNPHAGEEGTIGNEEENVITPAINQAKAENILAFGPYSADGFFGSGNFSNFDGVLAMYHDQALIPFKYMNFGSGVNYTAGLSIIRTSPDHGTGYDLAGKNVASEESFREAVYAACDIYRSRNNFKKASGNALQPKVVEQVAG
ncbi:MAG: 4-hydroxythreonine-4-phosphate dehydrogenase PdxA [Bacteroidetes bacterium]|nr:4-hydroxythreonine-4-phosphate dehydrogenase PdxA [Bacteroidia bacterium]MBL4715745.1 4-hydroxythreonine-4-phosphate dehydrogenase PdxA [Bacteroidia bacterium]PCH65970.1 MAG: 4-hydroxythreonine-4-phosphate dehydrogenase PdxA [Bacteroidota bacterium]